MYFEYSLYRCGNPIILCCRSDASWMVVLRNVCFLCFVGFLSFFEHISSYIRAYICACCCFFIITCTFQLNSQKFFFVFLLFNDLLNKSCDHRCQSTLFPPRRMRSFLSLVGRIAFSLLARFSCVLAAEPRVQRVPILISLCTTYASSKVEIIVCLAFVFSSCHRRGHAIDCTEIPTKSQ